MADIYIIIINGEKIIPIGSWQRSYVYSNVFLAQIE